MSTALKPIYRELPNHMNFERIARISVPHILHTSLGSWVHMSVVEQDTVPDPANLPDANIQVAKEHSLFIHDPKLLAMEKELPNIPLNELVRPNEEALMRVHSLCRFGDAFGSSHCDCGEQLFASKRAILERGHGIIFYAEQEGRNAGLTSKAVFYNLIATEGMPTSETFNAVGFHQNDLRTYQIAVEAIQILGLTQIEMMSNNNKKMQPFRDVGISVRPSPIQIPATEHNVDYLADKRDSMGHLLDNNLMEDHGNPHVEVARDLRDALPHLRRRHLKTLKQIIEAENSGAPFKIVIESNEAGKVQSIVHENFNGDPNAANSNGQTKQTTEVRLNLE